MWAMTLEPEDGEYQTPIGFACKNGYKGLVQHLLGLPEASEPPSAVMDSLIVNNSGPEVIQMFIQEFGKALKTNASVIIDRLLKHVWREVSNSRGTSKLKLLSLVIRNRPEELDMGSEPRSQGPPALKLGFSARNNLVRPSISEDVV